MGNLVETMQTLILGPGDYKNPFKKYSGLTLLELLVVLVILAITTALTSAKLFPDEKRLLQQDALRFTEILSMAQDQAQISGQALIVESNANGFRILNTNNPSNTSATYALHTNVFKNRTWQYPPIKVRFLIDGIAQASLLLPPHAHMKTTVIELEHNHTQVRIVRTSLGRFKIAP